MVGSQSRRPSVTRARVGDALIEARGIITTAAAILSCSPQTVRRMLERYPELQALRLEARAFMLEEAEEQLFKKARAGNVTACVFLCRTLGMKRSELTAGKLEGEPEPAPVSAAALKKALRDVEEEC